MTGNPLWLTGVDAPITKKHILKYLKILKKYLDIYLDILCSFMKFNEKRIFFVISAKKNKFRCSNIVIYVNISCLFCTSHKKNVFSLQNFMGEHKLFRCTLRIFCLIFFYILKCI
jgi:hypothetical protein